MYNLYDEEEEENPPPISQVWFNLTLYWTVCIELLLFIKAELNCVIFFLGSHQGKQCDNEQSETS